MRLPNLNPLAVYAVGIVLGFGGWMLGREMGRGHATSNAAKASLSERGFPDDPHRESEPELKTVDRSQWQSRIEGILSYTSNSSQLFEFAQAVPLSDFPALIEFLRGNKKSPGLRFSIFELWTERDPNGARTWIATQPAEEQPWFFTRLVRVWSYSDPKGVRDWVVAQTDETRARWSEAFTINANPRGMLAELSRRDPEAALDIADKFGASDGGIYAAAFESLIRRDPARALARAQALPTGQNRREAFYGLMNSWVKTDPAAAVEWMTAQETADWTERIAEAMSSPALRQEDFERLTAQMPQEDRERLKADRDSSLSKPSSDQAVALARAEADPSRRYGKMRNVLENMASTDPARASALWLEEFAQTGSHPADVTGLLVKLVEGNGLSAAAHFLGQIPEKGTSSMSDTPKWLAQSLGWSTVADVALQMSAGPLRTDWLRRAVDGLVRDGNLSTAQKFELQFAPGPERDAVIRFRGEAQFTDDPQSGAQTLLSLPNGRDALREHLQRWLKTDAPEARRWIAATPLLEADEKSSLIRPPADRLQ